MKKLILTLLLIVWVSSAIAAGTITFVDEKVYRNGWIQVTATCTADSSDGSYPDTEIPYDLSGTYLLQIRTFYGNPDPKEDSDLYLRENTANAGYDVLNGAGENMVDDGNNNDFQPTIDGAPSAVAIYGPLYIEIENNDVNSAVFTIVLDFIQ